MTSTFDRGRTAEVEDAPVVSVSAPTRRRPSWVIAGVVLVGAAALLGAYVFAATTDTISVTVAARDLQPGDVIDAGDLRVIEMGRTSELRAITADQQDLIIGLSPRAVIPADTLLNTGLFVPVDDVLPAGQVVVGASFVAGEVPTPTLDVGETVAMLAVEATTIGQVGEGEPPAATVLGEGVVWDVTGEATTGGASERVWVSLLIDEDLQSVVSQAAADELLRLSLVSG